MQKQRNNLPKVFSRVDKRRVLGVFNLCRGSCLSICLNLVKWVQPLQELLKAKHPPKGTFLIKISRKLWENVAKQKIALFFFNSLMNFI